MGQRCSPYNIRVDTSQRHQLRTFPPESICVENYDHDRELRELTDHRVESSSRQHVALVHKPIQQFRRCFDNRDIRDLGRVFIYDIVRKT